MRLYYRRLASIFVAVPFFKKIDARGVFFAGAAPVPACVLFLVADPAPVAES